MGFGEYVGQVAAVMVRGAMQPITGLVSAHDPRTHLLTIRCEADNTISVWKLYTSDIVAIGINEPKPSDS